MKRKKIIDKKFDYDVCIIGYGLASIYLANLLSNLDKKVLIIEKGSLKQSDKNRNRNINLGIDHKASNNHLGIKMGGNSSRWGGQLAEMNNEDFKKNYWGTKFEDFARLYTAVYKVLGIKKEFKEKKISDDFYKYKTIFLNNPDLSKKFKIDNKKNIKIIKNTTALNFIFKKNKMTKLICKNNKKNIISFDSKIFVIASGTIESVRLMLMNKKNKTIPFKNNRNIGKFFSDHIGFYIGKLDLSNNEEKFREDFENFYLRGNSVQPKIRYYDKKNKLNVSIEFKFLSKFQKYIDESKDLIKDIKNKFKIYKILKVFLNIKLFQIFFELLIHYLRTGRIKAFFDKELLVYAQSEHLKNSKSKIYLKNQKLQDGTNKAYINWKIGNVERKMFLEICEKLNKYLNKKKYGNLKISKNLFSNKIFNRNILDTNHSSGGLQISHDKSKGVCNKNLKVHGTKNLFILSSSVFPNNGSANVTLTLFALTHKLFYNLKKLIR